MTARPFFSAPLLAAFALLGAFVACSDDESVASTSTPTTTPTATPTSTPTTTPTTSSSASPLAPLALPAGCQPLLGGQDCFLPYPSDAYLQKDDTLPGGQRVVVTGAAKLVNDKGTNADVTDWMPSDGASKTPTILTLLGSPISSAGLVGLLDPLERSATLDSPTLIIEADTGALVPHFVDVDIREDRPEFQSLVLSPLVGLKERTRYVVAIRQVQGPDGALASAPEGFRRLRDRANDASLASLQQRFDAQVFAPIVQAGADRAGLQMAWDFTTGSDELKARDLLRVRELTLDWIAKNPAKVTVTSVDDKDSDPHIWRTVRGTVKVPLFLGDDQPGATLHRGADQRVEQNGEAEVAFVARIPSSVRDRFEPARPLAFGHGFFGSRDEIVGGSASTMADTLGMMFLSINWWGMSDEDLGNVLDDLTGAPSKALAFTDRVHQAMANWAVVTAAMRTAFADLDAFRRPADGQPGAVTDGQGNSNALQPLFDPSRVHFLGISQGHILGGTQAAFNPDLDRIALHVGGASLTQMMFRARPFSGFLLVLQGAMKSPFLQRKYTATMQPQFDRIDPGFWASRVLADKLPGSPTDRRVLQQAGIGDSSVPNLGSFLHARLLGLPQITPTPRPVFGLTLQPGPIEGSAFALYDMGVPDDFYALPKSVSQDTPVHNDLRLLPGVLDQMDQFFREDSRIVVSAK